MRIGFMQTSIARHSKKGILSDSFQFAGVYCQFLVGPVFSLVDDSVINQAGDLIISHIFVLDFVNDAVIDVVRVTVAVDEVTEIPLTLVFVVEVVRVAVVVKPVRDSFTDVVSLFVNFVADEILEIFSQSSAELFIGRSIDSFNLFFSQFVLSETAEVRDSFVRRSGLTVIDVTELFSSQIVFGAEVTQNLVESFNLVHNICCCFFLYKYNTFFLSCKILLHINEIIQYIFWEDIIRAAVPDSINRLTRIVDFSRRSSVSHWNDSADSHTVIEPSFQTVVVPRIQNNISEVEFEFCHCCSFLYYKYNTLFLSCKIYFKKFHELDEP